MSKVCILGTVDLSRMTMVSLYTEYLEQHGIGYDIIYVNKYKDESAFQAKHYYTFDVDQYKDAPFPVKLMHYWKMRDFAKDIFQKNAYDFVIVWGELTAFIFADLLAKHFPGRYCINIRDYFYNTIFFVRHRLKLAVTHAAFNTVSSDAFLRYLPEGNYIMVHSLNKKLLRGLQARDELQSKDKPIRILYIGLIARLPHAFKMIDELANDKRFEMIFAGIGSEEIDRYIAGKNITNVKTYGRFSQQETSLYLNQADILYNLYGCGDEHFDTALSIKLYYAIYLQIPIMAYVGTHTQEIAESCGICFSMKEDQFSDLGDRLYQWYHDLDHQSVAQRCGRFMEQVDQSHRQLHGMLDQFLVK